MHLGIYIEIHFQKEGVLSNTYGNFLVKSNTINLFNGKDIQVTYQTRESVRNQTKVNLGNSTITACFEKWKKEQILGKLKTCNR